MACRRSTSRRSFLKHGATALSAAVAAPCLIPRDVLGVEGKASANERVTVGYIGPGRRGNQLPVTRDAQAVAAADVNLPRAEAFAAKFRGKAFQDYRKLLEMNDLDAVIIASPDHWHALHSVHACQAGKDVYVEKPMTVTIREGRQMADAVKKYQRVLQVGSQQRSMEPNRRGCEMVRNGVIGKLKEVHAANYPSPWEGTLPGQGVPAGLDWDAWCGPTEPVPYHIDIYTPRRNPGWISFRTWSGGEMTGWGSHGLDQVQWALGMDDSGPVEVWVEGEKLDPPHFTEPHSRQAAQSVCDHPTVFFRYADGLVLRLGGGPNGGAVFIGEKGRITIDRNRCQVEPAELGRQSLGPDAERLEVSADHMQNWIDAIKSRRQPIAHVEAGHRSATVCHLGNIARWVNRKLVWDPVKEVFPGDDEANGYLARPQRKPYAIPDPV